MPQVVEALLPAIALAVGAVIVLLAAVWFGQRMIAPRIGRALDRSEADDEEPVDRPD